MGCLTPESDEIRRQGEGIEYFTAFFFEDSDLAGIVRCEVLIGTRINDGKSGGFELRHHDSAHGIAVSIIGVENTDLLVGFDEIPLSRIGFDEFTNAKSEVIAVFEG